MSQNTNKNDYKKCYGKHLKYMVLKSAEKIACVKEP